MDLPGLGKGGEGERRGEDGRVKRRMKMRIEEGRTGEEGRGEGRGGETKNEEEERSEEGREKGGIRVGRTEDQGRKGVQK